MSRTTITSVREYDVDGDRVRFDCDVDSTATLRPAAGRGRTVPVTLRFYDARTFRFELRANPEVPGGGDLPDLRADAVEEPVDLAVAEDDGEVVLDTGVLQVRVGLDPWTFAVEADGEVVFREQRADVDVRGNDRVAPLGFEEEEVNHGPYRVDHAGTAFELAPGEHLYGLGEQFTNFDKRGERVESWHVEPLGTETERAYKNVPFHLSTRGYGLLVDTTARVRYDLGRASTASATVDVHDDELAMVFFYGPQFGDVLETYTALTGRPDRPPKWSFGVWMSRLGYRSREQLEAVAARLREEEIPCDVIHLDPFWMRERCSCDLRWDTEQFPDPEGMIAGLHDEGFRVSLWEHPHVPVGTAAFETAAAEGYLVEDGTGSPYVMDRTCQGDYRGGIVDFTDPAAVEWWQDRHRDLLAMGVDTFKTDYGEYVPEDAVFANGQSGRTMHNAYPYLYNRAVYEVVREERGADGLVWARSAWTGSQRFPVHWGGDPQTTFNGMAAALRGGLSASLSGFGFWSHDVGGFRGEPTEELYVRWAQFGLLSSHTRCHGTTPREPWAFGERATEIFRTYARLRYRLLPYVYTYAEVAARTGLPVVRPLVLAHQDDETARDVDDQFLLGESLLVAPVFEGATTASVYLPDGEWVDHWTGERHEGPGRIAVEAPLERMPLFVRAGSVVPTREPTRAVQPGTPEEVTLETTLSAAGTAAGRFYHEDDDRMLSFSVTADGDTVHVLVDGTTTPGRFLLDVEGLSATPADVRADGTGLVQVEDDPAAGEWAHDAGEDRLLVRL